MSVHERNRRALAEYLGMVYYQGYCDALNIQDHEPRKTIVEVLGKARAVDYMDNADYVLDQLLGSESKTDGRS